MSYLERQNYRGICSYDSCKNSECFHRTEHIHHTWGAPLAGGPWSCVQQRHNCPYNETDDLIICKRTDEEDNQITYTARQLAKRIKTTGERIILD